jgi:site-specific DNA-methyltransferase (adenine-specific)
MRQGEKKKKRIGAEKYQDRKNPTYIGTKMANLEAIDSDTYYPTTVLEFPSVPKPKVIHRTQKPVELAEFLVRTYTNGGDLVLDNVAGSGTTGVACINTGRNFILMEKEAEYVEIVEKRLMEAKGEK